MIKKIFFTFILVFFVSACTPLWVQSGYRSKNDFNLASTFPDGSPEIVDKLQSWHIYTQNQLLELFSDMQKQSYIKRETFDLQEGSSQWDDVFSYLADRRAGAVNGYQSALQARRIRLVKQKADDDLRVDINDSLPNLVDSLILMSVTDYWNISSVTIKNKTCTIATNGGLSRAILGYRINSDLTSAYRLKKESKIDIVANNIDELYRAITTQKCDLIFLTNDEAIQISNALLSDASPLGISLGWMLKQTLLDDYANFNGFKSIRQLDLSQIFQKQAAFSEVEQLEKHGIANVEQAEVVFTEMKDAKYSSLLKPEELIKYIEDKAAGIDKSMSALEVKNARIEQQKAKEEEERKRRAVYQEEEKERQVALAKKYPYIAVLTCGSEYVPLFQCFAGKNVNTTLEIQMGNYNKVYNYVDFANTLSTAEFTIDLPSSFELRAQNASDYFILKLKILDRVTHKVLLEKEASQWRVVVARN